MRCRLTGDIQHAPAHSYVTHVRLGAHAVSLLL